MLKFLKITGVHHSFSSNWSLYPVGKFLQDCCLRFLICKRTFARLSRLGNAENGKISRRLIKPRQGIQTISPVELMKILLFKGDSFGDKQRR